MILTFELDKTGQSLDIHFDSKGRDFLVSLLSSLGEPPDHYHLLIEPGGEISPKRFDANGTAMHAVTLHMLNSDAEPVALESVTYHREREGKIERVEAVGGHEVNVTEVDRGPIEEWKKQHPEGQQGA